MCTFTVESRAGEIIFIQKAPQPNIEGTLRLQNQSFRSWEMLA